MQESYRESSSYDSLDTIESSSLSPSSSPSACHDTVNRKDPPKCRNCGLSNHTQKNCFHPVTSYGIILFYTDATTRLRRYLMICRKHTIGFIQLIRGKYSIHDVEYIQALVNVMTNEEITMLQSYDYKTLWEIAWSEKWNGGTNQAYHAKHTVVAEEKFMKLKSGEFHTGISLASLIQNKGHFYNEPEWGFPKGRPSNHNETPLQTALREFSEETMIPLHAIEPVYVGQSYMEECYKSYDHLYYRNIYFIYQLSKTVPYPTLTNNEVSMLRFMNVNECLQKIRNYYPDKKDMIVNLDRMLTSRV